MMSLPIGFCVHVFYLNNNFPLHPCIGNRLAVVRALSKIESLLQLLNHQNVTPVILCFFMETCVYITITFLL
jgi:hypothetical protein